MAKQAQTQYHSRISWNKTHTHTHTALVTDNNADSSSSQFMEILTRPVWQCSYQFLFFAFFIFHLQNEISWTRSLQLILQCRGVEETGRWFLSHVIEEENKRRQWNFLSGQRRFSFLLETTFHCFEMNAYAFREMNWFDERACAFSVFFLHFQCRWLTWRLVFLFFLCVSIN